MATNRNNHHKFIPLFIHEGWDFLVANCVLALLLYTSPLLAQVEPQYIGALPAILTEASGLQCNDSGLCYSFNDSDDNSRVYRITESGQFVSQLTIQGASQTDYEDIALAADGRIFIGDFGNNDNEREDLRIYILTDYSTAVSVPEILEYTYEDQSDFPPDDEQLNFDVEAMIHWQDSLYLFTRNRTDPFDGQTKIYALPDSPGTFVAQLRGQIFGNLSETHSSITAADISPSGNRIVWLSKGSIFLFTSPEGNLADLVPSYNFFTLSRDYEGVSFIDDCNLLLVEEGESAGIYSLNSCDIVSGLASTDQETTLHWTYQEDILRVNSDKEIGALRLFDQLGRLVRSTREQSVISTHSLSSGTYIVLIEVSGEIRPLRFHKW